MLPDYWQNFVSVNEIEGKIFMLSEEIDLSSFGADLKILSEEQCIDESTEYYPGKAAIKTGYFPVASCLVGSGDYYYINVRDGKAGPLYRIYHDSVTEDDELDAEGVDIVLDNYELLLACKRT